MPQNMHKVVTSLAFACCAVSCSNHRQREIIEYSSSNNMVRLVSNGNTAYFGPVGYKSQPSSEILEKLGSRIQANGFCLWYSGINIPARKASGRCGNDLSFYDKKNNSYYLYLNAFDKAGNLTSVNGKSLVKIVVNGSFEIENIKIIDRYGDGSVNLSKVSTSALKLD